MRQIPLTNSKLFAIVDDEDYERVSKLKWYIMSLGYVRTTTNPRTYLAVMIFGKSPGYLIDHKDGDKLNNSKKNFRYVTRCQSQYNRGLSKANKSGFPGVKKSLYGRWVSFITVNKKLLYLGTFDLFEKAVAVRLAASQKYHGEFQRKAVVQYGLEKIQA